MKDMLADGAEVELQRVLREIGQSPIDDPRHEHQALALDWLLAFGRCLVVGADLDKYGYPRPFWAARGLHEAHHRVQPAIAQAGILGKVLAEEDILEFAQLVKKSFENRVSAWLICVGGKYSLERASKELGTCNMALYLGLGILKKDCKRYDEALRDNAGFIQSINCVDLPRKYRQCISMEYQDALPWFLAGGLELPEPAIFRLPAKLPQEP